MKYEVLILFVILVIVLICKKKASKRKVNIKSYKQYSKFLGNIEIKDDNYTKKINTIIKLINKDKLTDINSIAKLSNCSYHECILKIKFLKSQKIIENYYVDEQNGIINRCSIEDRRLIAKYSPYIYTKNLQLDDIVKSMPQTTFENYDEVKKLVLEELTDLDNKNLLNGINIDLVDERIIYYKEIENKKKENNVLSVECPSCGALNDIPKAGKTRCEYCDRILEDKSTIKK